MRKLVTLSLLLTVFYSISAQNALTRQKILAKTNVSELNRLARDFKIRDSIAKAEAIAKANEEGWPVRIETDQELIELMRLDEKGQPMYYTTTNDDAAISTQTDQLHTGGSSGYNLNGNGMTVGEWDGGEVRVSHEQLSGRVTMVDGTSSNGVSWHATHVAGTLIGDGTPVARSKGMAPEADLDAHDWNSDNAEMAAAAASGLLISNHSYGFITGWRGNTWYGSLPDLEAPGFGFYNSSVEAWDVIAENAPFYLICKSAGNDRNDNPVGVGNTFFHNGNTPYVYDPVNNPTTSPERDGGADRYDCIGWMGNAKNILTVGAVNDVLNYTGPPSVSITSFSSWGPTDDGRIKPDIVGNGASLYSSDSGNNSDYRNASGTSMSSPNVAGSLILLQEHYINTHNSNAMLAATLKALIIHTARECGPGDGPDYEFGWGLLSARDAADLIQDDITKDSTIAELTINNGDTLFYTFESDGSQALRATICWTDPAGPTSGALNDASPRLVNDLDLRITDSLGSTTYEPYILDPANPSLAATTGDNDLDNVEQVYIAAPSAGLYTLSITHKGTLAAAQDVSLIVTGQSNLILPVEFISLSAESKEAYHLIDFEVFQQDVARYELQRWQGSRFRTLQSQQAMAHNGIYHYEFKDRDLKQSGDFLYRIKVQDQDGSISYSNVVNIYRKPTKGELVIYPNPAVDQLTIQTDQTIDEVRLFTEEGKTLMVREGDQRAWDLRYFPSGKYFISVKMGDQIVTKLIMKE